MTIFWVKVTNKISRDCLKADCNEWNVQYFAQRNGHGYNSSGSGRGCKWYVFFPIFDILTN